MNSQLATSRSLGTLLVASWLGLLAAGLAWGGLETKAAPAAQAEQDRTQQDQEEVFYGRLQNGQAGCAGAEDAILVFCDGAETLFVQAGPGANLRRFFGQSVAIRGSLLECPAGERYIALNSIQQTQRCEPQATAEPVPGNLALRAPVVANTHVQPNVMQNATDGDPLTYWYAPGRDAWIYVDLGPNIDPDGDGQPSAVTFNEARLRWGERHAVQYGVYVFDQVEGRWMRIYQKSEGTVDERISFPRALGRYVLLQLARSSAAEGGFALREIELYGVSTQNLALGSQVQASSAVAEMPAWQAVDGSEQSAWSSLPGAEVNPWIYARIPFGAALTEFRLLWDQGAMPATFRVGFYQDGEIELWSQTFESTNARQRLSWGTPIPSDAFYVFTEALGPSGRVQLHELELYGPAGLLTLDAAPGPAPELGVNPAGPGTAWLPLLPRRMDGLRHAPASPIGIQPHAGGLLPGGSGALGDPLDPTDVGMDATGLQSMQPALPAPAIQPPVYGPESWPDPR